LCNFIFAALLLNYIVTLVRLPFVTIKGHLRVCLLVYQRMRLEMRLASNNGCARRRLKHLSWRLWWIILCTLEQRMAVSHEISGADRCLFGLSSWLSTRSSATTCQSRSSAAWLPDNCTRLADSL